MTDQTEVQIQQIAATVSSILGDAAPVLSVVGAVVPGVNALAPVIGIAEQAIAPLATLVSLIYAMFHPQHIAALAASVAPPPASPAA